PAIRYEVDTGIIRTRSPGSGMYGLRAWYLFRVRSFSPSKITRGRVVGNPAGSQSGSILANLFFGTELVLSAKLATSLRKSNELPFIRDLRNESVEREHPVSKCHMNIVHLSITPTTEHPKGLVRVGIYRSLKYLHVNHTRRIIAPYVCLYSDPFIVRGVAVLHEELRVRLQRRQKFRIGHIHGSLQTIQWTS